jgi:glycosyltransferase involved in cell wall biosynthesis
MNNTVESKSVRVLMLLTNAYDPDPRVRQEALALVRMRCRVQVLAWDRDGKSLPVECMEGVEVERVFLRSLHGRGTTQLFFYAAVYLKLLWRAWKTQFDIVHCHDLDTLPLGFILGRLKRKPVVYDAHESFPDMLDGNIHPLVKRALVFAETFLIRRVDLLITVGEKLRRHFEANGARHSVVIGNWKRLEEYALPEEENIERRRTLGIPDNALVLVCITQLFKDRKIDELLQAVETEQDVHLIIGGKGALTEVVRAAAGRNPRIHYIDFVPAQSIAAWTCAADAVYYGFDPQNPNARFSAPNKLFEALTAGKPIISGNFGEIADVIGTASCGIILRDYTCEDIRDAIRTLRVASVRQSMAQNARRFAREVVNWKNGERILYREYSALLQAPLTSPSSCSSVEAVRNTAPAPANVRN